MDNRRICNCRTRAKCWMKQIFCTKWCLNGKVSSTKISPGLDGWRTYRDAARPEIVPEKKSVQVHFQHTLNRDAAGPEIVPEKKSGCPTSLFVEGIRMGEQQKQNEEGNVGAIEDDENSTNDDIKAVRSFKFVLVEHIRDLLKPYWKDGNLSRDAYKIIMKKSVDKIIESIGASKVPKTENEKHRYISASKTKIFEFIQLGKYLASLVKTLSLIQTDLCHGDEAIISSLIRYLQRSVPEASNVL